MLSLRQVLKTKLLFYYYICLFVFVFAENTAVNKNLSTDTKLDLLLSKIETLESQKSSDDDIVVEKSNNEKKSYFDKYGFIERGDLAEFPYRALIGVGLLGAFTTFSTFSVETLALLENGLWQRALLNVLLNVGTCLLAAWLAVELMKG